MKIKIALIDKVLEEVYKADVEGTEVIATYVYDMNNEQAGGWQFDLTPCFVDLDDHEIEELEGEFYNALLETRK